MAYHAWVAAIYGLVEPALKTSAAELQESNPGGRHAPIPVLGLKNDSDSESDNEPLILAFERGHAAFLARFPSAHPALPDWLYPLFGRQAKRKSCDFVIFWVFRETLWVFLVELKSLQQKEAPEQLAASRLLVDSLLSFCWPDGDGPKPEYRGIIINEKCSSTKVGQCLYERDTQRRCDPPRLTIKRPPQLRLPALCK